MKKVLILGASGCVGGALLQELASRDGYEIFGTYCRHPLTVPGTELFFMDTADTVASLASIRRICPDGIIACQIQRSGNFNSQFLFHRGLAEYAEKAGCTVYFCSTANAVKKDLNGPYREDCPLRPDCEYGEYKAKCESMYLERIPDGVCIMRLPQIWGAQSRHLSRLIQSAENGDEIELYPNLVFNVNSDRVLARQIAFLIERRFTGIVHLAASDTVRYSDFIMQLLNRLGYRKPKFAEYPESGNTALLSNVTVTWPRELQTTNQAVADEIIENCR